MVAVFGGYVIWGRSFVVGRSEDGEEDRVHVTVRTNQGKCVDVELRPEWDVRRVKEVLAERRDEKHCIRS